MNATVVIIPTYNEVANIQGILHAVMDLSAPFDVLVVDDNSPDGTADLVRELLAKFPQLHLKVRQNKDGLGPAYIHGFKWAMDKGYTYLFEMDADFSHPPKALVPMLALLKEHKAEAAFEGLRGLLEARLHRDYEKQQALKKEAKLHQKKPTARKSTAASRLKFWQKNKGTARKSTTPSSRGDFSWYGVTQEPVDFNEISTRMSIGGMEITLNASKLAGMVNLKPIIRVKDCEEK